MTGSSASGVPLALNRNAMQQYDELRTVAHKLRNLLQRVANRAECLETAENASERATHVGILMRHVEEAAAVIAVLDEMAARPER
jgi:hypothetical protein